MRARIAVLAALVAALAATAAVAGTTDQPPQRKFTLQAAGSNRVDIPTGQVREHWKGHATGFGKQITGRVVGWIQRPTPDALIFRGVLVGIAPNHDALIGICTGTGVVPAPNGSEDWTCDAWGGSGKFARSRGRWAMHIVLTREWIRNGVQKNRVTVTGHGKLSWDRRAGSGAVAQREHAPSP